MVKEIKKDESRKLICPIHGLVNAKPSSKGYTCEVDTCEIIRQENELEV